MNKNSLFRKIAYVAAIVLLLGPLFALGRPSNGMIGQLRTKYKMGQANLGKLDPTSESMRLATLGLKGIASTVLWLRADYYKEEKYFDRFSATLNQIALLQPHFISVWQHQAHNLSYNVAPEFEDYRQRYEWIKKGIDYLIRGTKYNDRKPILQYDLGHYVGQKLGKADEHVQYRALYGKDSEFHRYFRDQGLTGIESTALGYDQKPDNWLTGKLWFEQAVSLYEAGAPIKKSPHLLLSYGPLWEMYYAEAIQSEGILDARAGFAWKQAGADWATFGTKSLYQFRQKADLTLLSDKFAIEKIEAMQKEFDLIGSEAKKKAEDILRKGIPSEMLKVLDKPESDRSESENQIYYDVVRRISPSVQQISAMLPPSQQLIGVELGRKIVFEKDFIREVQSYRSQVNYEYWELRAKAEQREDMLGARRLLFEADQQINSANIGGPGGALELYEKAWQSWAQVFSRFPSMISDEVGDDVMKALKRYKGLLDDEIDERFVLYEFLQYRLEKDDPEKAVQAAAMLEKLNARARVILDAESRGEVVPVVEPQTKSVDPPANATPSPKSEPNANEQPAVIPSEVKQAVTVDEESAKNERTGKVNLPTRPPTLENPDSQE